MLDQVLNLSWWVLFVFFLKAVSAFSVAALVVSCGMFLPVLALKALLEK